MILSSLIPYLTLVIGFCIGFFATRGQVKNTLISVEVKQKEAETKKILSEVAQIITKTEERGGGVKIRSKLEQKIENDPERARVQELLSDNGE